MSATVRQLRRPTAPPGLTPQAVRDLIESGEQRMIPDVPVTPEIAAVLLEYNHPGETNRVVSSRYVEGIAAAIVAGKWENTGEPIIMSDAKLLNDGQHRLLGVVAAGVPAKMDLRFGIPRHAFAGTNAGRKRTGGQTLALMGHKNTAAIAAAARLILLYERGLPRHMHDYVGNLEIVDAVERWPDIGAAMGFVYPISNLMLRQRPIVALAFFAQRVANETSVREFFSVIATGEGKADNPPHLLREALLKRGNSRNLQASIHNLALGVLAWNAWHTGSPALLKWRVDKPFPVVEGLKL